jgi:protein ImuA
MQAPVTALDAPKDCPLGVVEIDQVLGGGFVRGALHELAAVGEAHLAAATGMALRLAGCATQQTVLWVAEDMSLIESGAPYGPGVDDLGLRPEQLLTVAGARADDVLWVMEEALHCRAVGAVIGEVRNASREIDLVATRRLSLAAATHGALALLLRSAPGHEASAAATRWVVGASPSPGGGGSEPRRGSGVGWPFDEVGCSFDKAKFTPTLIASAMRSDPGSSPGQALPPPGGGKGPIGPPRFHLALTRNRRGPLGSWMLEWSSVDASFVLATHSEPMARTAADRPDHVRAA